MNKTTEALKLAEALENDAKEHREVSYGLDCPPERTANWQHALNCEAAARLIREALAEPVKQEPVVYYAYATIKEYEELAGFSVSQAFRSGWYMARTTNSMLGINAAPVHKE